MLEAQGIFNTKCVFEARKVTSANGRVRDDEFMVGSCSDHGRIGRALELTLQLFSANFSLILECMQFCVAGAVFGEVGG